MSTPRGYSSYRGRKMLWKILIAILLVAVILAAAGFLLLQKYLVYDENGRPHLQLPADSAAAESAPEGASSDPLNITIDQPAAPEDFRAVQLGGDPAGWAAAAAAASQNVLCVTVKAPGGRVLYQSAVPEAPGAETAAAASAALSSLLDGKTYAIARLSCLRDGETARSHLDDMGLKNTGGYVFYDGNNENWLDPSKPATVEYLCALAKECAALGFGEILLTDLTYPTKGKLDKIDYNGADRAQALADLVSAVKAAVGGETAVSVELPETAVASGDDEAAGQNLSLLTPLVSRIYVPSDNPALGADSELPLVRETAQPPSDGDYLLLND